MLIKQTELITVNQKKAYSLVKNQLEGIAHYLPSVDKIQLMDKEKDSSGQDVLTNHWFAKVSLPFFLKGFISKELLSWKDKASWSDDGFTVTYELESFYGNDLFEAKGRNRFIEDGPNSTKLELECDVTINAEKIPGVPTSVAKRVVPAVEKIIEKMLGPNLSSLGKALNAYIANEKIQ